MKVETEGEELVMKKGEWGDGIGNEERGRGGEGQLVLISKLQFY